MISRVLDADAGAAEWAELELMAENDPTLWRDLGDSFRAEVAIRNASEGLLSGAEQVQLPATNVEPAPRTLWSRTTFAGAGWLAALILLCVWLQTPSSDVSTSPTGTQLGDGVATSRLQATPIEYSTAADALANYRTLGMEEGRLINELPMMLVDTKPINSENDQIEVFYLRRFLERTTIDQMYELGTRDDGAPVAVTVNYRKPKDYGTL